MLLHLGPQTEPARTVEPVSRLAPDALTEMPTLQDFETAIKGMSRKKALKIKALLLDQVGEGRGRTGKALVFVTWKVSCLADANKFGKNSGTGSLLVCLASSRHMLIFSCNIMTSVVSVLMGCQGGKRQWRSPSMTLAGAAMTIECRIHTQ